jgi:hypothetical protein
MYNKPSSLKGSFSMATTTLEVTGIAKKSMAD